MPMKARKDLGFTLFCRSLITLPWKFWSASYTTMFKKCATRQVWNVTFLMSCLFSVKILVRSLQARFQSTADVIILLAIKSDTTFSLDVYNFSTLFLVKLIFFLIPETKHLYYCLFVTTQGEVSYKTMQTMMITQQS